MPAVQTLSKREPMSLDDFHKTKAYTDLSPRIAQVVDQYILNGGDTIAAVRTIYPKQKPHTNYTWAGALFQRHNGVLAALAIYFQEDPKDTFKAELLRAFRKRKLTVEQVQTLKLMAQVSGFVDKNTEDPRVGTQAEAQKPQTPAPADTGRVPVGCRGIRNKATGQLVAYLTPEKVRVDLAPVEIA